MKVEPTRSLAELIRAVPDFPEPGILFRDITPLLLDPVAMYEVVARLAERYSGRGIERVAAIESRGFLFGAPLALTLGAGLVPVRKLGKLPRATRVREYALEYGTNHLELHVDAIEPGQRVVIVDDVLATGGTARATVDLVEEAGGRVDGVAFLIEIAGLGGRAKLSDQEVVSLLEF
ncbi:MAG: adenine phosphoribosyltransferase [Gemmatimonas sp.]|nr:adenine phosphoribosyltransferase [Gemmatimonas sp.]